MDFVKLEKLKEIYKLCAEYFEPHPKYLWELPIKPEVNICSANRYSNIRSLFVNEQNEIVVLVGCLEIDLNSFRDDIQEKVVELALDQVRKYPVSQTIKDKL